MTPAAGGPLLSVRDLRIVFGTGASATVAVAGASWDLGPGEVLAVVGESGSGKSVTALSLLGLLPGSAHVTGRAELAGHGDLLALTGEPLRRLRGAVVSMVFQDPGSTLNPVLTIGDQLTEAVRVHRPGTSRAAARSRALELLETVRLPDPASRLRAYPHQLSGGQLQRVVIAMALATNPPWWSPTNRPRPSTSRCRPTSSTSCATSRCGAARRWSSSRTTWAWSPTSPTASSSCAAARSWRRGPSARCCAPRGRSTPGNCWPPCRSSPPPT